MMSPRSSFLMAYFRTFFDWLTVVSLFIIKKKDDKTNESPIVLLAIILNYFCCPLIAIVC